MPSLPSRLHIFPSLRKRKGRVATSKMDDAIERESPPVVPSVASLTSSSTPNSSQTTRNSHGYEGTEGQVNHDRSEYSKTMDGERDMKDTTRSQSLPSNNLPTVGIRSSTDTVPPTPAPTITTLSHPLPEHQNEMQSQPLPTRLAKKASKISLTIVSDMKAGGASLLSGFGRKSQQSQGLEGDREKIERLSEMGILKTRVSTSDGYGDEKDGGGLMQRITPNPTHGIMKTATNASSGQTTQSVRFTLDFPPKLELDLSLCGPSVDNEDGRLDGKSGKDGTRGRGSRWAKATTQAVLDRSRNLSVEITPGEELRPGGMKGEGKSNVRSVVGGDEGKNLLSEAPEDATTHDSKPVTRRAQGEDEKNRVLNQERNDGLFMQLDEPGFTIHRLEDLAELQFVAGGASTIPKDIGGVQRAGGGNRVSSGHSSIFKINRQPRVRPVNSCRLNNAVCINPGIDEATRSTTPSTSDSLKTESESESDKDECVSA